MESHPFGVALKDGFFIMGKFVKFFLFWSLSFEVSGQIVNDQARSVLNGPIDQTKSEKFEVVIGPSFIYPYGNEFLPDTRVPKYGWSAKTIFSDRLTQRYKLFYNLSLEKKGVRTITKGTNQGYIPPIYEEARIDVTLTYAVGSVCIVSTLRNEMMSFGFGPFGGILVRGKYRSSFFQNGQLVSRSGGPFDFNDTYRSADFGLTGFFRLGLPIIRSRTFVQLDANLGLYNVAKENSLPLKNFTSAILFGIKF